MKIIVSIVEEIITVKKDQVEHNRTYPVNTSEIQGQLKCSVEEDLESRIWKMLDWYLGKYGVNK